MCNRRCHTFGEGYRQESNNRSRYDKRNSFQKPVTCFNCVRVGHFARFCRDKKDGREKTESKVAEAELKEVDIGLVTNGYITPVIKTVVAIVDGLNTDILLDTETHEALLDQERIYSPRFTAAMNLRSDSSKKSLDESVNTEEEEQEPTITEYDEENGNNTEKIQETTTDL
ncbi:retrovirus-related Pol polyprotein from transposon opus [Trichonephila clavipes]|nr:retrovirus-related Pol polyprotein from transposon opus [Trichonephila clavipes]